MPIGSKLRNLVLPGEIPLPPLKDLAKAQIQNRDLLNMNSVVGSCDILFLVLDSLRWDVAFEEQEKGNTPILNSYGPWEKRGASGNFTWPSHHAMFTGFLPTSLDPTPMTAKKMLFFPKGIGLGRVAPPKAYAFSEPTWIQALAREGYETVCIGGVSYFSSRTPIGSVFPGMFSKSIWRPNFACQVKESPDNQIEAAAQTLEGIDPKVRVMMYMNVDAIHYPNYMYLKGAKKDSKATHAAALAYVDERLPKLFSAFERHGPTFVICCSDHGTCYEAEDGGYLFHGFNHEVVNTVPYKHFFLDRDGKA